MSYLHHNVHTAGINGLKWYMMQVETRTDMSLLQSNCMAPLNFHSKIILGTS